MLVLLCWNFQCALVLTCVTHFILQEPTAEGLRTLETLYFYFKKSFVYLKETVLLKRLWDFKSHTRLYIVILAIRWRRRKKERNFSSVKLLCIKFSCSQWFLGLFCLVWVNFTQARVVWEEELFIEKCLLKIRLEAKYIFLMWDASGHWAAATPGQVVLDGS